MGKNIEKLLIGASFAIGVSAIATSPAFAGSLTNPTIGGSAASDYLIYDSNATNTFLAPNTPANLQNVLGGNANSPTGNVELRASSEQPSGFDFTKNTTLTGTIGGKTLTLSSLTSDDWFGVGNTTTTYGASNFANTWFNAALTNYRITNGFLAPLGYSKASLFTQFLNTGGFQRFSDPNISYVNQNDSTGEIKIGLAGHYDATSLLFGFLTPQQQNVINFAKMLGMLPSALQASEVVKYSYEGTEGYLYSFQATNSGLVSNDNTNSHTGNYEVGFQGNPVAVPEPSVVLSLLGICGIIAIKRHQFKKA